MRERAIRNAAFVIAALFGGVILNVFWILLTDPKAVDFLAYWAAGKMVLGGAGADIYDIAAHRAVESLVVEPGLMPFPYPPPFALLVAPFGALPFGPSFIVWTVLTGAFYLFASRRWMAPSIALSQPGVLINGFIGQNAFLTSGLFMGGAALLDRRPFLAGAIIGLLVIKPQLALMLPVAMIAGRQWHAILGGATSAAVALLAGLLVLGLDGYTAFFALLAEHANFVATDRWPWAELASVYALVRSLGVGADAAWVAHGLVALGAATMVWLAWRGDHPGKVAILAAGTLLLPPYLLTYDCILLGLAVAWLIGDARRLGLGVVVFLLSLVHVGGVFRLYPPINGLPVAAMLAMGAIFWLGRRAERDDGAEASLPQTPSTV
ncbi:glycosyltransferase family 87 protein [Sphingomonas sp. LY29]|uniref:glycosyltransferase family 87 protein n=1 Tax=Sphingomonas sp. LY29 TaxID=3095341 RepID=UPI002D779134|nr:glycosyltransferase family 87 protein [Sphingomonas sp. LY29]WRP25195.1 glycosyltransferase family 87 protein [Sphingomonas sp. LY29]